MAAITAATAAAGLVGGIVAKRQFIDRPKEKMASFGRMASQASADREAADKAASDKAASDKAAADKMAADKKSSQYAAEQSQTESRRAALNDMLIGEGDTNQRRRFLKGAK
jgi:hypothetical protein